MVSLIPISWLVLFRKQKRMEHVSYNDYVRVHASIPCRCNNTKSSQQHEHDSYFNNMRGRPCHRLCACAPRQLVFWAQYMFKFACAFKKSEDQLVNVISNGWRTKVRKTNYGQYGERLQTTMPKATTSITPSPQTFNVEKTWHDLGLRNFVPSHSLPSQPPRHANFELWGNGGRAKTTTHLSHSNMLVANFCPSTVL